MPETVLEYLRFNLFFFQLHNELREKTEAHLAQLAEAAREEEAKKDPII